VKPWQQGRQSNTVLINSRDCLLRFIQEKKHDIIFSGYLQYRRKKFSSGELSLRLADIHMFSSTVLKLRIVHTEVLCMYLPRGWMDLPNSWHGAVFVCRKVFSSVSLPDVILLLQCSGSAAQTFPMQELLTITQGDSRLSHCRLGG